MERWKVVSTISTGALLGVIGFAGCSGKMDSTAAAPAAGLGHEPTAVGQAEKPAKPYMTADRRYAHALELFDQGAYIEAEGEFEEVCRKWPKFSKPFKHLARTQMKLGKFEQALDNALEASDRNPKDGTIDNVIGLAYMELDDFDSAEASFRTAIAKSPKFPWPYNNLGYLMIQRQDYAAARDVLQEGGTLANAPPVLLNNLGIALKHTGDTAGAKEAFAKAVEMDPTNDKASTNLTLMESILPDTATAEAIAQVVEQPATETKTTEKPATESPVMENQ